jgi:hypothetical protein
MYNAGSQMLQNQGMEILEILVSTLFFEVGNDGFVDIVDAKAGIPNLRHKSTSSQYRKSVRRSRRWLEDVRRTSMAAPIRESTGREEL